VGEGVMTTPPIATDTPAQPEYTALVETLDPGTLASQRMLQFVNIDATINHNAVGAYTVMVPYTDDLWDQIHAGDFIVRIGWRGLFTFGGKCEQPTYSSSLPGASGGNAGGLSGQFITLSGADYLAIVANRIAYPDPTKPWSGQLANSSSVVVNAPLETAIKYYVNSNMGPNAISSRVHPLLDIAADQGRGPAVIYSVNFHSGQSLNLMDVIRAMIAKTNSKMGVRVTQNGSRLLFDVYMPVDKTGTAWFAESLGNLTSINFSLTDPTCTDALVQGATPMLKHDGTADPSSPSFIEVANPSTSWTKVEQYTDDTAESNSDNLDTTARNALYTGSMGPNMAVTATESPFLVYGRDYSVGDIVSVSVRAATDNTPEVYYQDVVSSATLTCDATQQPIMNVVPVIGNATDPSVNPKTATGQLLARIKTLEKALATKGK
jgi:hypothetical protein